jgi:hypothetical protein
MNTSAPGQPRSRARPYSHPKRPMRPPWYAQSTDMKKTQTGPGKPLNVFSIP